MLLHRVLVGLIIQYDELLFASRKFESECGACVVSQFSCECVIQRVYDEGAENPVHLKLDLFSTARATDHSF